ncbi:MAG: hypothetical protein ACR2MD_10095 [Aridibacter sp.]
MLSVTFTILFILAVYFFGKSIRDEFVIEKSQKTLKIAQTIHKNTAIKLNQTQDKLLTKSNQLNEIIEGTTDLIAAIDKDFNLLFFNESFRKDFRKFFGKDI